MSKKWFLFAQAIRVPVTLMWFILAGAAWYFAMQPSWVAWLYLLCGVLSLTFVIFDYYQYQKAKSKAYNQSPSAEEQQQVCVK